MYLFQVFVHARSLSPQQGQQALQQMIAQIDQQRVFAPDALKVVVPGGANQAESVFPDWLAKLLVWAGLAFDNVNFCYCKSYATMAEASAMLTWFDQQFRAWMIQEHPEHEQFIKQQIQVRVMDAADETQGLDAF